MVKLDIVEVEPKADRTHLEIEDSDLQLQDHHRQHHQHCKSSTKFDDSQTTPADVDDTGNELVHWIMKYPVCFFAFYDFL